MYHLFGGFRGPPGGAVSKRSSHRAVDTKSVIERFFVSDADGSDLLRRVKKEISRIHSQGEFTKAWGLDAPPVDLDLFISRLHHLVDANLRYKAELPPRDDADGWVGMVPEEHASKMFTDLKAKEGEDGAMNAIMVMFTTQLIDELKTNTPDYHKHFSNPPDDHSRGGEKEERSERNDGVVSSGLVVPPQREVTWLFGITDWSYSEAQEQAAADLIVSAMTMTRTQQQVAMMAASGLFIGLKATIGAIAWPAAAKAVGWMVLFKGAGIVLGYAVEFTDSFVNRYITNTTTLKASVANWAGYGSTAENVVAAGMNAAVMIHPATSHLDRLAAVVKHIYDWAISYFRGASAWTVTYTSDDLFTARGVMENQMLRVVSDAWSVANTKKTAQYMVDAGFEVFALGIMRLDRFSAQSEITPEQMSQVPLKNIWMSRDELDYLADVSSLTPNILREVNMDGDTTYMIKSRSGIASFKMKWSPESDIQNAAITMKALGDISALGPLPGSEAYRMRRLRPGSGILYQHVFQPDGPIPGDDTGADAPGQASTRPASSPVNVPVTVVALTCVANHDMDFIDHSVSSGLSDLDDAFDPHTVSIISSVVNQRRVTDKAMKDHVHRTGAVLQGVVDSDEHRVISATNQELDEEEFKNHVLTEYAKILQRLDEEEETRITKAKAVADEEDKKELVKHIEDEEFEKRQEDEKRRKAEQQRLREEQDKRRRQTEEQEREARERWERDRADRQRARNQAFWDKVDSELSGMLDNTLGFIKKSTAAFRSDIMAAVSAGARIYDKAQRMFVDTKSNAGDWLAQTPAQLSVFINEQAVRGVDQFFVSESSEYNFHRNLPSGLDEGIAVYAGFLFAKGSDSSVDTSVALDMSLSAFINVMEETSGQGFSALRSIASGMGTSVPDPDISRRSAARGIDEAIRRAYYMMPALPSDPDESRRRAATAIDVFLSSATAVYFRSANDALAKARGFVVSSAGGRSAGGGGGGDGGGGGLGGGLGGSSVVSQRSSGVGGDDGTGRGAVVMNDGGGGHGGYGLLSQTSTALTLYINSDKSDSSGQPKPIVPDPVDEDKVALRDEDNDGGDDIKDKQVALRDDDGKDDDPNTVVTVTDNSKGLVPYKQPNDKGQKVEDDPKDKTEKEDDEKAGKKYKRKRQGRWVISRKKLRPDKIERERIRFLSLRPFIPVVGTSVFDEQVDVVSNELKMRNLEMGMTPHNPLGVLDNRLALSQLAQDGVRFSDLDPESYKQFFTGGSMCDGDRLYGTKRSVLQS